MHLKIEITAPRHVPADHYGVEGDPDPFTTSLEIDTDDPDLIAATVMRATSTALGREVTPPELAAELHKRLQAADDEAKRLGSRCRDLERERDRLEAAVENSGAMSLARARLAKDGAAVAGELQELLAGTGARWPRGLRQRFNELQESAASLRFPGAEKS